MGCLLSYGIMCIILWTQNFFERSLADWLHGETPRGVFAPKA